MLFAAYQQEMSLLEQAALLPLEPEGEMGQ